MGGRAQRLAGDRVRQQSGTAPVEAGLRSNMLAGLAAPVAGALVGGRVRGGGRLLLPRVSDDGCLLGGLRHAALAGTAVLYLLFRRCDLIIASPTGLGAEPITEQI